MAGKFYSFHISNPQLIEFLDNLEDTTWRLADGTIVRGRNGYIKAWLEIGFKHRIELWPQLFQSQNSIKTDEVKEGGTQ